MKIIQVTPDFPPNCGGIGYYVLYLCKELQRRGHDVEVLYRGKKNGTYFFKNIIVNEMKIPGYPPLNLPLFRREVERKLVEKKAEIVHVHSSVTPVLSSLTPVVVTGHCCNSDFVATCYRPIRGVEEFYRNITLPLYSRIEKRLSVSCDRMTVVSKTLEEQYMRHYGISAKVIYNAVDPKVFVADPEQQKKKTVLFTGRLSHGKGLSHLLQTASMLKESQPDAVIQVIGNGPLSHFVKRAKAKMGLVNLEIIDHLPHARLVRYYQSAKVYFLPSYYEGFSNSILEAMSCQLPVVASDISSLREQVVDGVNGYLVPKGDAVIFHKRISDLLNDEKECKRLGEAGRRIILENFTWKHVGDLVETQYKELIHTRATRNYAGTT